MKTAYNPLTDKTNKYVSLIVDAIKENKIDIVNSNVNLNENMDYEIINLNWYESIYAQNNYKALKEYIRKILFLKKLKRNNIKIIWTVHNRIPHDGTYVNYAKSLMKSLVKNSDKIVIHCKETIKILKELSNSIDLEKKIYYIPHPSYEGAYDEKNIDFRRELNIHNDELVFLFVGQIRPYKNIELIIKNAKQIKNNKVKFVIAGNPSNREYGDKLKSLIGDNENIITLFKYIDDDELVPLMKASDVVLLPYDLKSSLNSGVAILSFTCAKTVVCPYIGTLKDIGDKSLFYSYTYDESTHERILLEKIQQCCDDFEKNKSIIDSKGRTLSEIVNKEYSKQVISKKYKELYDEIKRG